MVGHPLLVQSDDLLWASDSKFKTSIASATNSRPWDASVTVDAGGLPQDVGLTYVSSRCGRFLIEYSDREVKWHQDVYGLVMQPAMRMISHRKWPQNWGVGHLCFMVDPFLIVQHGTNSSSCLQVHQYRFAAAPAIRIGIRPAGLGSRCPNLPHWCVTGWGLLGSAAPIFSKPRRVRNFANSRHGGAGSSVGGQ